MFNQAKKRNKLDLYEHLDVIVDDKLSWSDHFKNFALKLF